VKPVYPKSAEHQETIKGILKSHDKLSVLFGHLEGSGLEDVVNAFSTIEASRGEDIIRQGTDGDRLYIINEGEVDIFVARRPSITGELNASTRGTMVAHFGPGSMVGELALLYNTPRAATVTISTETASLWALDRDSFQMLLAANSCEQLAMYEGWLSEVPIFKALNHFELAKLADIMESTLFDEGEVIIQQGTPGDCFFLLEDGTCSAFIAGEQGEVMVKEYTERGDYFGELALITNEARKASVRATGDGCMVVSLSKEHFTNVLGPIVEILKRQADLYPQYASFLK
jgi:cAMP-dependent protein kinase regulator